jgi:3-oxoacyl-[acyl-carrier protein] reductase
MYEDLAGKRVLITGASTGIGAAAARGFAASGAHVAVHFNRNAEKAETVIADIRSAGGVAYGVKGDLTDKKVAKEVVARAAEQLGGLDILVNNAGSLIRRAPLLDIDDQLYDETMDLNVRSVLSAVQAAVPLMGSDGGGAIINVGSIAGSTGGGVGSAHYATAKAAVHTLTRHLATDLAGKGIRVNAIAPGVIATPFHDATPADRMEAMRKAVALGRVGTPEDCVGPILFLASSAASGYVTGQILHVNGGQYMP